MSTEIEWLDADGSPLPAVSPSTRQDHRASGFDLRSVARWVEVGWLLVAVLAVVAPFLTLYGLQLEASSSQQVDGWGRFSTANTGTGSGAHEIRFGMVTVVAAGFVLIGLVVRRVWPARGLSTTIAALGEGLLAATSAAAFLDIDALYDSVRSDVSSFAPRSITPSLDVGAGAWTMLGATAVGLAVLVVDASRPRIAGPAPLGRAATPTPGQPEPQGPPLQAEDESL